MIIAKYDRIYADPFESVDIYTKQCSVGVNAAQLARMGATLANNGVNPATGEQVIKREHIPHILSAMTMAGLYDGSGGWAWHIGLPAKSGVGGGIVAIAPGKGAMIKLACFGRRWRKNPRAKAASSLSALKLSRNNLTPRSLSVRHSNRKSLKRVEVLKPILRHPNPSLSSGAPTLRTVAFGSPTPSLAI
jgi:glutaminase